ncbi:MAG: LysM peptidoglycan-binding domain-containing protein [Thermomicrobiales bacterium]
MNRIAAPLIALILLMSVLTACSVRGEDDEGSGPSTSTTNEVLEIVTLTPAPSATVRTELIEYVVGDGDTLSGIADEFGVSQGAIIEANGLPNPDAIFVGQTLMIPAPAEATPEA